MVDTIFGLPGDGINGIMEGLRRRQSQVRGQRFRAARPGHLHDGSSWADRGPPDGHLFNLGFAWAIVAFFALSALAHFGVAGPGWGSYRAQLLRGRNPYRWLEYSLSASIMIVLIAMLVGISDIAALVALIGVNASMIGFGWMQERYEQPGAGLGPFWIGCLAGIVPWIAITIYLVGPGSDARPPAFVYGIFFSLFVLFNCFAVNQWLQYKQVGRWKDYLVGERVYVTLSLIAKSLLAWQIFAATLASSAAS